MSALPGSFRKSLAEESEEDQRVSSPDFPSVTVCAPVEEQVEQDRVLLSLRTSTLLALLGTKKGLYSVSVKVLNKAPLDGVLELRWLGLTPRPSPTGSWRSLHN